MASEGSHPSFAQPFGESASEFCRLPPSPRSAFVVFDRFFCETVPSLGSKERERGVPSLVWPETFSHQPSAPRRCPCVATNPPVASAPPSRRSLV